MSVGSHFTKYRPLFDTRAICRLEVPYGGATTQCSEIIRGDSGHVAPHPLEPRCVVGHDAFTCFVSLIIASSDMGANVQLNVYDRKDRCELHAESTRYPEL